MSSKRPLVSVIIPTYNTANYILEAVESVLAQTYQNLEIIVVDDGSTDNTREVLQPYFERITYIWQENQERAHTRNNGIRQSQGDLIAFLDADDIWLPEKISEQVAALLENPEAALVYGIALNVDGNREPVNFWGSCYSCGEPDRGETPDPQILQPGNELLFGTPLMPSVVMARRSALDEAGLFDPKATPVEDWELWLRLAPKGAFVFIPKVVCEYRAHGTRRELEKRANDHNLAQWLYVVQKTAENDPQRYTTELVNQATGSMYSRSALASYELGDYVRGSEMLRKALEVDQRLKDITYFSNMLEYHVERILSDSENQQLASEFLDTVLAHLPSGIPQQISTNKVLSRVYMARAFQSGLDTNRLRSSLWKGIRIDPSWLRNRGVIALLMKLIFPVRPSKATK